MSSAPLEGDAVFEGPRTRGHHFPVLQRDELDSTAESARGHLTKVGRIQGSILGVRARLLVFTSMTAASTIHLYLVSLTVW